MLLERKMGFIVHWTPSEIQSNSYLCGSEDEIKVHFITWEAVLLPSSLSAVAYKLWHQKCVIMSIIFLCSLERPSVQPSIDFQECLHCGKWAGKWSWTLQLGLICITYSNYFCCQQFKFTSSELFKRIRLPLLKLNTSYMQMRLCCPKTPL